ncbi:TPA: autotransporter outer membrane beta-barrel domain-containing protein [Morganella morganii]
MNTIYRIVWSKVLNTWVVASELAKGKQKTASGRSLSIAQHSASRLSRYFKLHFLATAILSAFTAIPAYAISPSECAASSSCVSVSSFTELRNALTTGDKTTILFLNDIKLTGNIDVKLTENTKQNIVIDGGGYKLDTGTSSFNFNNLNNANWANESTFTVSNLSGLVSSTSIGNYIFKTDANASTKINIILDDIGSVTDSMIAVLGNMGNAVAQNTSSELTFGNITSPVALTFGTNHQLAQANKINFTGKLTINATTGSYPAVFWSNASPAESIIRFTADADVSIKTPNLTNGAGSSNKHYQYLMDDGAAFSLTSDQNIFGSDNNGLVLGSYDPVNGFGNGVSLRIARFNGTNFTAGDGVSNSGGISTGYDNGPTGNKDVVFNLAGGSLINISGTTSNGILATKTGTGNSSNIYLASGGELITGTGISAAHAGSGNIVLENKTGGKITAVTGIKAVHSGTGSASLENHGDITSTANGISVSSANQQTVNINNTGGTINATSGNAVESLLKAQINMLGGVINTSGSATAFKLNDGTHQLTDITVNLNGTGNMFAKTAAAQAALTGVTLNVLNGTGLSDISGLTFKAGQKGNNTINVNGSGTGIALTNTALSGLNSDALDINVNDAGNGIVTTGGGVDLSNSKLTVNVTSPEGTALSIADGSSNITTIGQNIQLNAAGATALSFTGTAGRTLINNGTIGGDVKFAGNAAQTITNNGTLSGSLTTGNGNDILTLGAGSKSTGAINLGNGNNQVNIDNGADIHSVTTGSGDDIFTLNNLTQGSSYLGDIDSGSGNNTLNFNHSADTLKNETTLRGFSNINLTDSDITLAADSNISGGTVLLDKNSQLQFGNTFNGILNASLGHLAAGDGNAVVSNNAAVTLSKANTFTGNWLIAQGGTLTAGNSNQLDGSSLTVDGTLNLSGISELNNALTGSGKLAVDGGGNNFRFGALTGNAYTGHVQLKNALFSLSGQNTQSLAHASLTNSSGTTLTIGNGEQAVGNLDLNGGKTQFTGDGKIATGTLNVSSNGIIQVDPLLNTAGNLLDADTGTNSQLISSNNTLTAEELARLSLQDLSGNALQNNVTSAVIQNGETVADGVYNYALSGAGTGLSLSSQLDSLTLLTGKILTLSTQGAVNSDKALTARLSGAGALAIDAGAETLTINNSGNNYTGNTLVRTGTLALGSDNALGQTSSLNVNANAAANLAGHTQTTGALENAGLVTLGNGGVLNSGAMSNNGTVDLTGGTLNLSAGGTSSATGGLTGNGTLSVTGGDLSVSAANSGLAGTTQIGKNASVTLRDNGTLGTAAVAVTGTLNLLADNLTLVNALSGDGQVSTQAAVTLSGDNRSFTGEHHLNSNGKLAVSQAQNLGADSATVHLDVAGAALVLSNLSGSIHNALYGVSGTTVSVTGGSKAEMTADNSGFLGNWQVSGDSLLRVAAGNNLGKDSSVNLAAAGDTLQLAGYQGIFANNVSGSGLLSLTDSAAVTLDSTQKLGADLAVGIADNSALTLSDLAGFDHALTGSGTLNISRHNAADTFDFGSKTGTAFAGNVSLKNTTFDLTAGNTAALSNATLTAGTDSTVRAGQQDSTLHNLTVDGGTLEFEGGAPQSKATGIINADTLALNKGTVSVSGTAEWNNEAPALSLLEQDRGNIMQTLINAGQVSGTTADIGLVINGVTVGSDNQAVQSAVKQDGTTVANATHNYGLSTANNSGGHGLFVKYKLSALELLTDGTDALRLTTEAGADANRTLNALLTGSGGLQVDASRGALTLANSNNSYRGITTVTAGILKLGADNALGQTSSLKVNTGAAADLAGHTQTTGALENAGLVTLGNGGVLNSDAMSNSGTVDLTSGTLNLSAGGTSSATGGLTGNGTLSVTGGDLSVSAANSSLAGTTQIGKNASVTLRDNGTLGTAAMAVTGTLNLLADNLTLVNALSGNGQVSTQAAVTLSGDNRSFTGEHHLNSNGKLTVSQAQNLGADSATVHLDDAGAALVLSKLSGSIHQALYGVSGTTVSVTGGSKAEMTADNSAFLGNWLVSGDSLLRVAAGNNLGKDSSVNLAAAGDTLQLAGYQGIFANNVSGSGLLSLTDSAAVTLDSTHKLGADLAVGIADNSALTLSDLAGFDHALTGSGTLNISRHNAADTFDFGSKTGTAFAGNVSLKNTTFDLTAGNTAALSNATLTAGTDSTVRAGQQDSTLHNLTVDGGTLEFEGGAPQSKATGIINADTLALNKGTVSVSGTAEWNNETPVIAPDLSLLEQDRGNIMQTLINAGQVSGTTSDIGLVINGVTVGSGNQAVQSAVKQDGTTVANATHNYGLSTSDNKGGNGLFVKYSLSALELLTDGTDALRLTTEAGADANRTLNALLTGSGGLQVDASRGALTLANSNNSYRGITTVTAGILKLGADNALGQTSSLKVNTGAAANLAGHTQTTGALENAGLVTLGNGGVLNSGAMSNSGTVDLTGGTLNLSAGGTSSATGGLTGDGTLSVTGGDLSVSAANSSLAGTTQIGKNASVTLRDNGTLGTAAVAVTGTLNLLADNLTLVNALSGNGQVSTQAAVTLSGDNRSFTGEHHLNSNGKLTVSQAQNLGADSAAVHLDAAGAGLVLSKLSGSIHNALYGVSGTTVSVTGGSKAEMTADNSAFLGNWLVSGDSLLRVAAGNNLGKDSSVNLAAAGDTLQLAGYQGIFANNVSGSGLLSLTDSAAVTLDSTQKLGADLAVGIADNSALTLSDLAGFDHALTGSGTLNISRHNASDTFDFGSKTGSAFAGNVSLKNTGFVLDNLNTAALTNATLILSEGNITSVSDGVQKIGGLTMNGGALAFNHITDYSGEFRSEGTIEAGTIDVTGGGEIRAKLPGNVTPGLEGMSLLELDEGSVIVSLASGQAKGSGSELTLTDENGQPLSQDVYANVSNTGSTVTSAKGTFNYGLTTGAKYDGLYINYGLKALELLATGDDALKLEATAAKNGTQSNGLSALVSGSGDLVFAAVDDNAVASLSNGKNSYTGATLVRKGHLRADADGALGQTSELALADGTSADMNQTRQTIGALNTAEGSTLLLNDGHLTIQNGGTAAGQLSGKGELTLNGGELTLAQANTALNAVVNIAAAAQANLNAVNGLGSGDIRNDGKLVLSNTQGNFTNNLSGQTGRVDLTNNSAVYLSGDNRQYSGLFSTAAGSSLTASHADQLGNSSVQNDGVLHLNTDTTWAFTNQVSGSGDIIKNGKGTLQLTDSHVSAGNTLVENGLLQLGGDKPVTSVTVGDMDGYRNPIVTVVNNVVSLTSNVSVSSQGAIGGYGRVNGNVSNAGRIIMPHALTGNSFADFTINGNYSGKDGSRLIFDTVLAGDNAATDRLVITGNADGSSKVTVHNIGGHGGDTADGIKIIDIAGQSGANFELEGRVVAGAYEYHLYQGSTSAPGDGNWYLRTENPDRPEAGSYTANLAAANTIFVSSMADRSGETLYTDIMTGEKKSTSMWLRTAGSHNRSRDNSGTLKTQDNRFVTQFGGDVARWSGNGSDLWRTGLMAGYARSHNSSVTSGSNARSKGTSDGYNIGLYGTWFADSQTRTGAYADSWVQYSWFRNEVNGEGLDTEKYDSKGFTASLEGGYILKAGESQNHQFWVQPKAQAVWMGVKADDHTEASNTRISGNGDGNIQTRLGVKAFMTSSPQEGGENNQLFKPYAELTWVHNSKDFGTTLTHETTGSYTVKQGGAANIAEVKLGMEGNASPQLNMWGNVTQQVGDKGYSDTAVMLGVKYNF